MSKIDFEIHFGVGIKEHEQVFDVLRKHGAEIIDGKEVSVAGTSAWKTFSVADAKTGEVIIEKKFHKPKFNEIMTNPEYSRYIDLLLEKAMVKNFNLDDAEIDVESYEEVRSISLDSELGESGN